MTEQTKIKLKYSAEIQNVKRHKNYQINSFNRHTVNTLFLTNRFVNMKRSLRH